MKNETKYRYYVIVFDKKSYNKINYVTSTKGSMAFWKKGEKAKAFKLSVAKDIVFGLSMNFIPSAIVTAYDFLEPYNDEGSENNES